MRGFWLLVHILGFVLWIGGGVATMVAGVKAKSFAPDQRLAAYRLTSAVQRILVGPGVVGVVLSGFALFAPFMRAGAPPGWLTVMMGAGIIGAVVALTFSVPTASRLGRLEVDPRGELPEAFAGLRKRQVISATVAGSLALIALFAGTLFRG